MAKVTVELGGSAKPVTFDVKYAVARAIITLLKPQQTYGRTISQVFMDDFIHDAKVHVERGEDGPDDN